MELELIVAGLVVWLGWMLFSGALEKGVALRKPPGFRSRAAREALTTIRQQLRRGTAYRPRLVGDHLEVRWGGVRLELSLQMAANDDDSYRIEVLRSQMHIDAGLLPSDTVLDSWERGTPLPPGHTRIETCAVTSKDFSVLDKRLSPTDIRQALIYLSSYGRAVSYRAGIVEVVAYEPMPAAIAEIIRRQLSLSRALCAEHSGSWEALARSLDLEFEHWERPSQWQITGRYRQLRVELSCRLDRRPRFSRVTVWASGSFPAGFEVGRRGAQGDGWVHLPDPILGSLLAARGQPAEAVTDLLCQPSLVGPLLEWVQERGGSISGSRVIVEVPGTDVEALVASLEAACDLGLALGTASATARSVVEDGSPD